MMAERVRSMRRLTLGATIAVVLLGCLSQSNRVRSISLLFPSMAGFDEVAPDVWAERGVSALARARLLEAVAAARGSIERTFSSELGHPVVLACGTARCFRLCGGIGRATTFFGDRVLLSPDGVSPVKVSHELSHVELATRVGAVRALLRVPQWFDEGLAVLASEDPDFDEARWLAATERGRRVPTLDRLGTLRGFLAETQGNKQLSYGTARHEVAGWYARVGAKGVERLFTALRAGESFRHAYASVLRAAARQDPPRG